jgi:hypothetical protein
MARWNVGRISDAARAAAASLKAEYEAGKRGDDAPTTPLWRSPREQLDAVLGLLRAAKAEPVVEPWSADAGAIADADADVRPAADAGAVAEAGPAATAETDADAVAEALQGVDWHATRTAMAERTAEAARTVRAMAEQVDWGRVQPVAAQVSSALIAAVAAGQLPIAGRLGPTVARAIVDQGGFGRRVGDAVQRRQAAAPGEPVMPDFRGAIEATSRET